MLLKRFIWMGVERGFLIWFLRGIIESSFGGLMVVNFDRKWFRVGF